MRRQHRERGHRINGQGFRNGSGERLREERDTTLRFASRREELALQALVALRDEERGSTEATPAVLTDVDLVIKKLLDVLNGEQVFAVHRDDDGIPDL